MTETDPALRVTDSVAIPLAEIVVRASRSSGPGGQHANVTASRVEATFDVQATSALTAEQRELVLARCGPRVAGVAQDTRSQARNRDLALQRLAARLAAALYEPAPRRPTTPTPGARERRLSLKRRLSQRKLSRRAPDAGSES